MTQADRVYSTPPTNTSANNLIDPPRRAFLIQAAAVAAGGTALGVTLPLPRSANAFQGVPDPIFDAIEAHKAARMAMYSAVDAVSAAERELNARGVKRSERQNDARLAAREEALTQAFDAETEAACVLVTVLPTTFAGVKALLAYANVADTDGEGWPADLVSDDKGTERRRSWHFFLIENLAETLPGLMAGGAA